MRRGGGSRGGSFGGGGFSGGGFRGSGSRSHSSSRMYRSSRRHYHHRPYYGGRPYYGNRYYGRRRYGGYGYYGPGNIFGLLIFLFIFMLVVALAVSATVSSDTTNRYTLAPGEAYEISYGGLTSSGNLGVSVNDGTVQTLVFDSTPSKTGILTSTFSYPNESVAAGNYQYFGLTLSKSTDVSVTWESNNAVSYYAIKGESKLKDWESGKDTQFFDDYGTKDTHTFTVSDGDTYFFAILADNVNSATFSISFLFQLPAYDLSNNVKTFTGSFQASPSDIDGNSVLIYNPSTSNTADVTVTVGSTLSFGGTFFIIVGLGAILLYYIYKRSEDKKKEKSSQNANIAGSQDAQTTQQVQAQVEQPAKSEPQKYVTRPAPKYCNNCGAAVLEDSKFCIECGTAVTR